jgi:hypothetical protein
VPHTAAIRSNLEVSTGRTRFGSRLLAARAVAAI